jgi:ribokinase
MFDVITIGAALRDVYLKSKYFKAKRDKSSPTGVDLVLPLGSKIGIENIIFETGGGASNSAVTFTRQDLRAACIARVGDDPGGRVVLDSLKAEGVNTELVYEDKENYTGYSLILVAPSGERTVLVYRGASSNITEHMIPRKKLDTKWIFISSLAGRVDILRHIVEWADKHDINTAVIPGGQELKKGAKVLSPIFSKADLIIMNREEAAEITGVDYGKKEKIAHQMCLLARGIGVVTDARNGATACDDNYFYHIGTHDNPAVDRTGAGDAFASGFVAGLIKYENVEGALELAADNASNVVNYFGAKKGIIYSGKHPFKEKLKVTKVRIKL